MGGDDRTCVECKIYATLSVKFKVYEIQVRGAYEKDTGNQRHDL